MKTFEWNRFLHTLCWIMRSNKGALLRMAVCMFVLFFCMEEIIAFVERNEAGNVPMASFIMCMFVWQAGMYYSASQIIADTGKKTSAITFLMHPSSNAEKYIARWVYVVVVWAVVSALVYVAADVFRFYFNMLVGWHFGDTSKPVLLRTVNILNKLSTKANISSPDYAENIVVMLFYVLWAHSFFILGGSVFRRHRFILSTFAFFVLQLILSVCRFYVSLDSILSSVGTITVRLYILMAVLLVFISFNYWASYRIFTRMGIAGGKYLNVRYDMFVSKS